MTGIDDFFYVTDASYDNLAEQALPHYHEAHEILVACLPFPADAKLRVLDLGTGTGVTSAYILRQFPEAQVTGVDLFEDMLAGARARLQPFGDRVTLVQGDNAALLRELAEPQDVIVSAFCIHHLSDDDKVALFALIHQRLRPGGVFLMLDWTTFGNAHLRAMAREHSLAAMRAEIASPVDQAKWTHHWNHLNRPAVGDVMVRQLNDLGFQAETVARWLEVSLMAATVGGQP